MNSMPQPQLVKVEETTIDDSKRIEYVRRCIDEAQTVIRQIDTKTGFAVTVLAAIIATLYSQLNSIIKYHAYLTGYIWISLVFLILLMASAFAIVFRILRPTNDPSKNIIIGDSDTDFLPYFMATNIYGGIEKLLYPFRNSDEYKLSTRFDDFLVNMNEATSQDVFNTLSYELLKVTYIRNIKSDRFQVLVVFVGLIIISLIIFVFLLNSEVFQIEKLLNEILQKYLSLRPNHV